MSTPTLASVLEQLFQVIQQQRETISKQQETITLLQESLADCTTGFDQITETCRRGSTGRAAAL